MPSFSDFLSKMMGMENARILFLTTTEIKTNEERLFHFLSPERAQQARSYAQEKDRLLSLGAGYFLRKYIHAPLRKNPFGKLEAEGQFFSLSHSGDKVAFLLSPCPCGVDIETREKLLPGLKEYAFSKEEALDLKTERELLLAWTRKEALAKAEGSGLSTTPLPRIPSKEGEVEYKGKRYQVLSLEYGLLSCCLSCAFLKKEKGTDSFSPSLTHEAICFDQTSSGSFFSSSGSFLK